MSEVGQKIRLGIGSAAAAAAIFAPLRYKWKGVLTAVAADAILSASTKDLRSAGLSAPDSAWILRACARSATIAGYRKPEP